MYVYMCMYIYMYVCTVCMYVCMYVPISLPATSNLGRPISCGKFVFPSHYLPLPILDVCVSLEVPRFLSNLIKYSHVICQKMGKYLPVRSAHNSHVMCIIKNT